MAFRWISMFSGAGCGDLGLHRAGHEIVAGIENEKQPAGVFAYNFPDVPLFCDIKKVDADDLLMQMALFIHRLPGSFLCWKA